MRQPKPLHSGHALLSHMAATCPAKQNTAGGQVEGKTRGAGAHLPQVVDLCVPPFGSANN